MALHGYFTFPEINWPLYVAIPTLPLPLWEHCKETGLFLMRQLVYLTTDQFQTPPEILGTAQFTRDATGIYVPDRVPIATNHEIQELQEAIPSEVQRLSDITSRLATPRRVVDVHSFLSRSRTLDRHEQWSNWHLITLISLGIITILTFLGYFLKTCQGKLSSYNLAKRNTSQQGAHEPGTTANVPDTLQGANDSNSDSREKNVVFGAYPLQTRAWDKLGYCMQVAPSSLHPRRKQPGSQTNRQHFSTQLHPLAPMYSPLQKCTLTFCICTSNSWVYEMHRPDCCNPDLSHGFMLNGWFGNYVITDFVNNYVLFFYYLGIIMYAIVIILY